MHNAGWLVNGANSPGDVIESLYNNSPTHTPGYFLLLSVWGNLMAYDLAVGRVLTIFIGLLSISVTYRLARDFIAPVAGLFSIVIVASNAFYNFYIPHVRMYPLLLFAAGASLWIYLRIMYKLQNVQRIHFVAFGAAVYVLLNIHAFSIVFLATLGIYHVSQLPRNEKWKQIVFTSCTAFLFFAPWLVVLLSRGAGQSLVDWGTSSTLNWEAIFAWLAVTTNGQPLLLLLSIVGLVWAKQKTAYQAKSYLWLAPIFLLVLTVLTDATPFVNTSGMRYQLPGGWHFLLLVLVAGLHALYSYRKWLGMLILLWVVAGASFQLNADWKSYISESRLSFADPPWQLISAQAAGKNLAPFVAAYRVSDLLLEWPSHIYYTQREHNFDSKGIEWKNIRDPHEFRIYMSHEALVRPEVWIISQASVTSTEEIIELKSTMRSLEYELCETVEIGVDTVIHKHVWNAFTCSGLAQQFNSRTELIDYRYYGAIVDKAYSKIQFSDEWSGRDGREVETFMMSYQLISSDWENVAQLDLPLVHEGIPRRFSIDISGVPAGAYRLITILYDKVTGERITWIDNDGELPYMLALAEIEIPDED